MHHPKSVQEKEMHKILMDFVIKTKHLIPTRSSDYQQKKKKLPNSGYCRTGRPQSKNKREWKEDKYLDHDREQKIWNLKVMVMLIVTRLLEIIPKGLVKELKNLEIRGQIETIQTTVLLRSARLQRRVIDNESYWNSSEKPSVKPIGIKKKTFTEYNNDSSYLIIYITCFYAVIWFQIFE